MESYNTHGDHVVMIMIKMPVSMTEEQKELIREYAYLEKDTPGTINEVDRNSFIFKRKKQKEGDKVESEQKAASTPKSETKGTETAAEDKGMLSKLSDALSTIKT